MKLNYDSLLFLAIIAFFTPFLVSKLKRLKIPYQVGEIFIGIIVGKSFLNIIRPDVSILFLYNLGLAYLMFLSGLEINFNDLKSKDKGSSPVSLAGKMIILSLISSVILSFSLKFVGLNKGFFFFALIFMASAPGLVVPILKSKNILKSQFGQVILIFSIFCELVNLIGVNIYSSIATNGLTIQSFEFLLIFLAAIIVYFVAKRIFKINDFSAIAFKNHHLIVRGAFALILILVVVSDKLNSSIVLGSFLAGAVFSLLVGKAKEEISHQLDLVGYGFLIPIFFIMIGVNLDLKAVFKSPGSLVIIPLLLVIFFLVKFIPTILLRKKFGKADSNSSSLILTAQLTLVIISAQMALDLGYLNQSTYSAFVLTTIISCILFPILFEKFVDNAKWLKVEAVKEEKIIIREFVVTNEYFEGKPLKDCDFPIGCRVFSIIRNEEEFMPSADSTIEQNDLIILAGVKEAVYDTMHMLTLCNLTNPPEGTEEA